ncbi:hypothetical protein M404DRAFT_26422 [Pisolithus tinctorius Marx 270]|uniref:Major facilitator superfamily (MFS) profile domain-containing protein n=1 Tax=Pisolithus tinctorius Marx 270 TaxID=870435 RepID=A0A0C3K3U2_PISTI|nr:hypothetical protein M404DRAFT_26422 [Pisolithus tinctorius Marx 270]
MAPTEFAPRAWIGSYTLIFLPGLVTGRLFDLGHFKIPYFIASCGLIGLFTGVSASCSINHLQLVSQALLAQLFSGIAFSPAVTVVSHWFSKKKGLALGITATGSSLGGTLFPIVGQNLIPLVGFKWTVRVFGFMTLAALGIANFVIDRRLPPMNVQGGLFNLSAFRNLAYTIYCVSGILCFLGLYTALTYLPASATTAGVSSNFAFYLVAIANAASGFGRLSAGWLADRIGKYYALLRNLDLTIEHRSSQWVLIAISVIYGFASGTYVSLLLAPPMAMGDVGDVGRRVGMFLTIAALGTLVGTPISGAINARTGDFKDSGLYAGTGVGTKDDSGDLHMPPTYTLVARSDTSTFNFNLLVDIGELGVLEDT